MSESSPEIIMQNIVRIVDKDGKLAGTGFFIQKDLCITCHHNIWKLDRIFVTRDPDDANKRYEAVWMDEYSDDKIDLAVLRLENAPFRPPSMCTRSAASSISSCKRISN